MSISTQQLTPNREPIVTPQAKSVVRAVTIGVGGMIFGYLMGTGKITQDQVINCLNTAPDNFTACIVHLPPQLAPLVSNAAILNYVGIGLSAISMAAAALWGWVTSSRTNIVATANSFPEVAGVIVTKTVEGVSLAKAIPSPTVAVAGTVAAQAVSAPEPPPPPLK